MSKRKIKWLCVVIEIIVLIILLFSMFSRIKGNNEIPINLGTMVTAHDEVKFDGTAWALKSENANALVGDDHIIYGPGLSLEKGSYTLVLNYQTTKIQKGVVEAAEGVLDTADYFLLSNNKNEVRYDFWLSTDVEGFQFRLKEYLGGDFQLNGITIIRNTHDIRCIIIVWICFSIILNILLFSNKYKKHSREIAIILYTAFVASLPLFANGMMCGNDIRYHLVRIEGIADGIRNGVFPVKMYSVYNDSYGYPVGIFYGDVMLYVPAILRLIGFTIMQSYKAYIVMINILTTAIAFYCGKKMFRSDVKAGVFSLAFTLSTYRLVCLYARAAVGEYSAFCFYPIVILAIWNIYTQDVKNKEYGKNSLILALGMTGLIYNHILSTEMFVMSLILVALALVKKTFRKETIYVYIKAVVICGVICLAFIIPFLEYYMGVDIMIKHKFAKSYIQSQGAYISDYFAFFKSITGGDYPNRRGILTPGLVLMVGLVIAFALIVSKKADKKIKFLAGGSVVSLLVASNVFPWNAINDIPIIGSFLVSVQFPYRYIGVSVCFLSVLLVLVLDRLIELKILDKKVFAYSAIVCLTMSILFNSDYQDEAYITSIIRSYDKDDLLTYTRTGDFGMYLGTIYLIEGTDMNSDVLDYGVYGDNITATIISESGVQMEIAVNALDKSTLEVPRFAYPHFVAKDENGNVLKTKAGNNNKLTIIFEQPYQGTVYIDFIEPLHWRIAELISLIAIISLMISKFLKKQVISKEVI